MELVVMNQVKKYF